MICHERIIFCFCYCCTVENETNEFKDFNCKFLNFYFYEFNNYFAEYV